MKTDKPRTMRRLLGYVGRHKAALAGVFVFALIGNTSLLLAPKLIGRAIDLILPGTGGGYLAALLKTLAVIGVLYLAGSLFNWLTALCANLVANRTVRALRVDLFGKLGRLPLQYYDTHSHGDMMSRFTNDIDAISDGLNQGIVQLVSGVMTVLLYLAFMLSLNPMVTLVAVSLLLIAHLFLFTETDLVKIGIGEVSLVGAAAPSETSASEVADPVDPSVIIAERFSLSPRETDVLPLLLEGRTISRIQETLFISAGTVSTHIRHIYQKTGVDNRQELIDLAHETVEQAERGAAGEQGEAG